jgi:Flp pilus assembly pilin Flp
MVLKKGGEKTMEFLKRLVVEEEGQGLVEYSLIVLLVALVFWVAIKGTNADQALSNTWNSIVGCLNSGTGAGCGGS